MTETTIEERIIQNAGSCSASACLSQPLGIQTLLASDRLCVNVCILSGRKQTVPAIPSDRLLEPSKAALVSQWPKDNVNIVMHLIHTYVVSGDVIERSK